MRAGVYLSSGSDGSPNWRHAAALVASIKKALKMKKHSGFGKEPARLSPEAKVIRYLSVHTDGLSTLRMNAWIESCRRGGGYTMKEFNDALRSLRDSGRIAFANGVWYLRGAVTVTKENT